MKHFYTLFFVAALLSISCMKEEAVELSVDTNSIEIGPEGGVRTIQVKASERWVASTQAPWITVSPANGIGSTACKIIIDTTLLWNDTRTAEVFINGAQSNSQSFTISQKGYDYQIVAEKSNFDIEDYADYGNRSFSVKVRANVDFKVRVPDAAQNWLKFKKSALNLDRQARPREVVIDFNWEINSVPFERIAGVTLEPIKNVQMGRHDSLKVVQKAAPEIEIGTVKGDSLALLAIHRALGMWYDFEVTERIENWNGVEVWKTKDERNGRVRSASFAAFTTKEPLPYEVQYLTAAEELSFFGNSNTFLIKQLNCGPYICKLTQLRKLTIGAYGLTELHEDFKNLVNLEYLGLESNHFQRIPEVINPETFPKLSALVMNANTRYSVLDLSNDHRENLGGLIEEDGFPTRLLTWENLDTIRLSANYLQGPLPTDEQMDSLLMAAHGKVEYWTREELIDSIAVDTTFFEDNKIPKVLPNTDYFAINLNRLYGELPKWLLYHPKLDFWGPEILVWSQEGNAQDGTMAQFSNAPTNMNYYYDLYVNKRYNPKNFTESEDE